LSIWRHEDARNAQGEAGAGKTISFGSDKQAVARRKHGTGLAGHRSLQALALKRGRDGGLALPEEDAGDDGHGRHSLDEAFSLRFLALV
jgi:hypothetical protein